MLHYNLSSAVPIGSQPAVSVILVSDYAAGDSKSWADLRVALAALSRQDFDEPAEFLLFESERFRDQVPADLTSIVPSLQVHFLADDSSNALKNAAVRTASAEIVAILDADCIPDPSWLRLFTNALRTHPRA